MKAAGPIQRPSPTLQRCLESREGLPPGPILDIPSGNGRNAILFDQLVVCVDNDWSALQHVQRRPIAEAAAVVTQAPRGRCAAVWTDLTKGEWPFPPQTFAGIVHVHFVQSSLFSHFQFSLKPGGFLYCETFGGHGENYLALPKAGEWKRLIAGWLDVRLYEERPVGPAGCSAVTVKLFGRKLPGTRVGE